MPVSLDPLLPHLPAWLLVLFRLTGMFIFAPLLGSKGIPAQVKVFWALGLSFCVYPMLLSPERPSAVLIAPVIGWPPALWLLPVVIATELLIGLLIGYGASLPLIAMQVGGQIADQQMGLGIAEVFNPELQEQTGAVGQFYYLLALTIFVILGGHRLLLVTLVGTFDRIPLGGFRPDGAMLGLALGMVGAMFELAMRVSAPLLCLVFLETVATGFIARTLPQLNVLSVGFVIRILIGAAMVAASLDLVMGVYGQYVRRTLQAIGEYFGV